MVRIVRRNNRPPLMTCLIVVFSFVAVGILAATGVVVAVIFLSAGSPSTGSSPSPGTSSVGSSPSNTDPDGGSGASSPVPAGGGWSSGG